MVMNVVYGESLFLLCGAGVWLAEVNTSCRCCRPTWLSPNKNSGHKTQVSFCGWHFTCVFTIVGLIKRICVTAGRGHLEAWVWLLLDFTPCAFSLADLNLCPFAITNWNYEYNRFSESYELFKWIIKPEGGAGGSWHTNYISLSYTFHFSHFLSNLFSHSPITMEKLYCFYFFFIS